MSLISTRGIAAGAALLIAGLLSTTSALAGPMGSAGHAVDQNRQIVLVGGDWDDDWDDGYYYRHRRYYRGDRYVRAPFTRVRTRGWRSTSVDAPFTSVRVRPHGVWVRAPFVNIYVPR